MGSSSANRLPQGSDLGRGGSQRDATGVDKTLTSRRYHDFIGRKADFRVGLLILAKSDM